MYPTVAVGVVQCKTGELIVLKFPFLFVLMGLSGGIQLRKIWKCILSKVHVFCLKLVLKQGQFLRRSAAIADHFAFMTAEQCRSYNKYNLYVSRTEYNDYIPAQAI